jgi:hypothetical protein
MFGFSPVILFALAQWCGANPASPILQCPDILKRGGASLKFSEHTSHAIHSLTVSDLQKFEQLVTIKNKVPTVNRDMSAIDGVLLSAPDLQSADGHSYKTDVMKIVDEILMHMDDPEYFRRYTSFVERVAHEAHMYEHWAHVLEHYNVLRDQSPGDEFCKCAMDVENNGVMDSLRNAALIVREPKLTSDFDPTNYTQFDLRMSMLFSVVQYPTKLTHDLFDKPEGYQLRGKDAWVYFKANYGSKPEEVVDAALFLHCALKEERDAAQTSK